MRTHLLEHKPAYFALAGSLTLLLALVWSLPVAFSGYSSTDADAWFWYLLSESGGVYGTVAIVLGLCVYVSLKQERLAQSAIAFAACFAFFAVALGSVALLNEHVVKPLTQVPRPSHRFLLQEAGPATLAQFYRYDKLQRQEYLKQHVAQHPELAQLVNPEVLEHWVYETGFSFPSGHSQNTFLLGSLLTFLLGRNALSRRRRMLLALPVIWAVLVCLSRVAIGVHTELDVSFGAFSGALLALLLHATGLFGRLFRLPPASRVKSLDI